MFAGDDLFKWRCDQFGYELLPSSVGLPLEEAALGIDAITKQPITNPPGTNLSMTSNLQTKISISDTFRQEVAFFPCITIKHNGAQKRDIAFNQNAYTVHYRNEFIKDGYGNVHQIRTPTHLLYAGAWDSSFEIRISALSVTDREELTDIVSLALENVMRDSLLKAGLFIKKVSIGGENEVEFKNDYLYETIISIDTYSEWSREIPIRSVIERINVYFDLLASGKNLIAVID